MKESKISNSSLVDTNSIYTNKESENPSIKARKSRDEKACKTTEKKSYKGFDLINEYVEASDAKELLSSTIINSQQEVIMESTKEIGVIELTDEKYLLDSNEQTMIVEIIDDELEVLTQVTHLTLDKTYKVSDFLNRNGVVILSNYSPEEKRNFEYLYDYTTGKRISSGFDSIDEIDGKLKVTYGLATGNLDLEGNFIMEPDIDYPEPKGFFARLFK